MSFCACSVRSVNAYGVCFANARTSARNVFAASPLPRRDVRAICVFCWNVANPSPVSQTCFARSANPRPPVSFVSADPTFPSDRDVRSEVDSDVWATCSCAFVARRM